MTNNARVGYSVSEYYVEEASRFLMSHRPSSFTILEVAQALDCSYQTARAALYECVERTWAIEYSRRGPGRSTAVFRG